jgi:hypothetical protein
MARRMKVKLNHGNIQKVLTSNQMYDALETEASEILDKAKELAPVETGAYKDSLHLERDLTDRAVVRVVAGNEEVEYALGVEAKHAVLGVSLNMSHKE